MSTRPQGSRSLGPVQTACTTGSRFRRARGPRRPARWLCCWRRREIPAHRDQPLIPSLIPAQIPALISALVYVPHALVRCGRVNSFARPASFPLEREPRVGRSDSKRVTVSKGSWTKTSGSLVVLLAQARNPKQQKNDRDPYSPP